jgi:small conductance mechanosensitive channel
MSIDYGESLERVELVIRDNLEEIKKHIPEIVEGPFYKGVTELGGSSVDLLFMAKCSEQDIYQVQRDLNREFYVLFNKNNINIPFPQVTLSNRETEEVKITKSQEKQARAFADDQAEISKGIEDKSE